MEEHEQLVLPAPTTTELAGAHAWTLVILFISLGSHGVLR